MRSAPSGSKRWSSFHDAIHSAIKQTTHQWTYKDFQECFPLWCEEEPASSLTVFNTLAQHMESSVTDRIEELLQQLNVQESLDRLQAVVLEARARKQSSEPYEGHDLWRDDLQPRAAVRARTIPVLEKERERLKEALAELEQSNLQLQAEMQVNVKAREDADAETTALLDYLEQVTARWDEVPMDEIEAWALQTAESIPTTK